MIHASKVYREFSTELCSVLNYYEFWDGVNLIVMKSDLYALARAATWKILEKYKEYVFINDVKWHHFEDPNLPWESVLQIFLKGMRETNRYVSKIFETIPTKIYDLDSAEIDGNLKEQLLKLKLD